MPTFQFVDSNDPVRDFQMMYHLIEDEAIRLDVDATLVKAERNLKYILKKIKVDLTYLDLEVEEPNGEEVPISKLKLPRIQLMNLPIAGNMDDQFSIEEFTR